MKKVLMGLAFLATVTAPLQAQPIKPNPGEGKYHFCLRMYDSCMTGVFGKPGSQSYNVGRARCYGKWNSCRKSGSWPAISASATFDTQAYSDEVGENDDDALESEALLEE